MPNPSPNPIHLPAEQDPFLGVLLAKRDQFVKVRVRVRVRVRMRVSLRVG